MCLSGCSSLVIFFFLSLFGFPFLSLLFLLPFSFWFYFSFFSLFVSFVGFKVYFLYWFSARVLVLSLFLSFFRLFSFVIAFLFFHAFCSSFFLPIYCVIQCYLYFSCFFSFLYFSSYSFFSFPFISIFSLFSSYFSCSASPLFSLLIFSILPHLHHLPALSPCLIFYSSHASYFPSLLFLPPPYPAQQTASSLHERSACPERVRCCPSGVTSFS